MIEAIFAAVYLEQLKITVPSRVIYLTSFI